MNEYLRRIDKRDYLTEREHREYLEQLEKDLEILEILKSHIILTDDFRYIRSEKRVNKEDCEKIIRWLDNDK